MKPDHAPPTAPGFKHTATVVVAILAFTAGALTRNIPLWMLGYALVSLLLLAFDLLLIRAVVRMALGTRCPACTQAHLERRAVLGFGDRFYACPVCGIRVRRKMLGAWRDASGPEFDSRFLTGPMLDPWSGEVERDPDEPVLSPTHAALLKTRRLRHPDQPNGPGLTSHLSQTTDLTGH